MSKHFGKNEFTCNHCGALEHLSTELVAVLELVRHHFGKPVVVNSGYRCETHNKNVGGAPKSKHLLGIAADIRISGVKPKEVYDFLGGVFPDQYGIGLYDSFTHIDVREGKGRW